MADKPRQIVFTPDRFIANVVGCLTLEELGVYWVICSLIFKYHGPVTNDQTHIARRLRARPKKVAAIIESLIRFGYVDVVDGKLSVDHCGLDYASEQSRGSIPRALRVAVFERDEFACVYCRAKDIPLECDHVIPYSRGGPTTAENLVAACKPCNRDKGARTPEEWLA